MGLNLVKGSGLNLTKTSPGLKKVKVGLGWDVGDTAMDLDVVVFAKENGNVPESNVCFYNQKNILNGAIVHGGDNRTGAGDGDDETITIDLEKLSQTNVDEIDVVVFVYNPDSSLTFGKVKNSFVRLVNDETQEEKAIYKLEENFFAARSVLFGKIKKENGEWNFKAVGQELVGSSVDAIGETIAIYVK